MITLVNFGDSPFAVLFIIVAVVFLLTLLANLIAAVLRLVIDKRTKTLIERGKAS